MQIERHLKENKIIIFVIPTKNYGKGINDIALAATKTGKSVTYVTVNKPYNILLGLFESKKIDTKKITFIDAVSGSVSAPKGIKVEFVSSPKALTELSIIINEHMKKTDSVLFDSVSTLLVYDDPATVVKFIHSILSKARASGTNFVLTVLSEDAGKSVLKDVSMFVDKVVVLK